ncbi:MAG: protein translocase subunit SecD [Lachnospiraceae bacterium]|nr:protein translocase subunit SecD [Lachnospiraceae bacterium]
MKKKKKGILSLVLMVAFLGLLGFTTIIGFGKGNTGAAKNIKLGLDLAGGVSITYEATDKNPTAEQMSDTIYKLQKRVEQYSTEASVYQEGTNRISIEIPGVSDANSVLTDLGKPGSLEFQTADGTVVLEGTDIKTAKAQTVQNDMKNKEYIVALTLTDEGKTKFAEVTAANIGKAISIVYDGAVISSPTVESAITGGEASISGMESYEAAESLASTIRIGGLQLQLQELRSNVVGAQLGEEAISTSLLAGIVGLSVVFVFMCIVYLLPGFASSLALLIYTGLVLVMLNAFNITLTLPGIAGIILSIGMAVDANVIIFARVKEEVTAGKNTKTALTEGFHKALPAIVDGNITTLIAAIVLGLKGTGGVKGFAQTLALGIVVSMFTALVITRIIIFAFFELGIKNVKYYGIPKKNEKIFDFISKRYISFAVTIVVIICGFVSMGIHASQGTGTLNYSLEFKGGASTNVTFNDEMVLKDIDKKVVPIFEDITGDANVQVQKVEGTNEVIFKTRSLKLAERESLNTELVKAFGVDEKLITSENISSTISSEMKSDAFVALGISMVCMLLYIWLRFKDIRFATSAIVALIGDVLVIFTFYAVSRVSVGGTFIACMLTIVGYSINATIVIFDRIREELKVQRKQEALSNVVNRSITQTLTRSIYTNLTAFITIAALYIFGVSSIREFALPLMVGIIGGAFTSVCVTGPLWYMMRTKLVKKK